MVHGARHLGDVLLDMGVLKQGALQAALAEQRRTGIRLGELLVERKAINTEQLSQALAEQQGLEWVSRADLQPEAEALAAVDASTARAFGALPLSLKGGVLRIAVSDTSMLPLLGDLTTLAGVTPQPVLAEIEALADAVRDAYQNLDDARAEAEQMVDGAEAAPIVKLLESILTRAVRDGAADVHFEPYSGGFRIRMRVDGVLFEIDPPPAHLARALVSRIKVMANLDISETRMPQDGRVEMTVDNCIVDLRVSTVPTTGGESVVLRILDRRNLQLDLGKLGLEQGEQDELMRFVQRPHGIVLVTGPTGSGKTTTLYSLLSQVNTDDRKILTVEDPVEYDLDGIVQIPVRDDIGVSYARVLRTMLRQDPDIILVGEIRDPETAQIAVEASLTGHLVLSTLHTNDAASTVTRMVDLGVEPFMLAATLEGIVAQRLIRCICKQCSEPTQPSAKVLALAGLSNGDGFSKGRGCEACHFTGYSGRQAIFEIMPFDGDFKDKFLAEPSTHALQALARERKMQSLRERGLALARTGVTTLDEIVHGTQDDDS